MVPTHPTQIKPCKNSSLAVAFSAGYGISWLLDPVWYAVAFCNIDHRMWGGASMAMACV